ncbi:hypothetical protein [Blastococcus sp. TF02A-35]|uniref:hypothetical protein n=1 Tax=Blastococcus sp. TF02A-35 TaxID=2559612 RepID=UPI001073F9D1|nr:hypothetical protein [Blastococcus sp. TF02A_35]TFV49461.1 hypothetical protein E4P43_12250 [Blastococcus sp. TF02A_35]
MISDARGRPHDGDQAGATASVAEDDAVTTVAGPTGTGEDPDAGTGTGAAVGTGADAPEDATPARRRGRRSRADDDEGARRPVLPLVPVLAGLLLLLVAAATFLFLTRDEGSPIAVGEYGPVLQAARSNVVDLTSFDHLTLDDDIRQIEQVTTGELSEESVAQLDERRQEILDAEAVVSTEVVGAGVTRAEGDEATVLLVIESTQKSKDSPQAQALRYRIEVELEKIDDRWLLSAIRGG